jgi:hypothetical protein
MRTTDEYIDSVDDVQLLRTYLKQALAEKRRLQGVIDYWFPGYAAPQVTPAPTEEERKRALVRDWYERQWPASRPR